MQIINFSNVIWYLKWICAVQRKFATQNFTPKNVQITQLWGKEKHQSACDKFWKHITSLLETTALFHSSEIILNTNGNWFLSRDIFWFAFKENFWVWKCSFKMLLNVLKNVRQNFMTFVSRLVYHVRYFSFIYYSDKLKTNLKRSELN